MYQYFKGLVTEKTFDSITLEVNGIGYYFTVAHSDEFKLNSQALVYCFYHVKEDGVALFGFANKESRNLFLKLNTVSGIGPKTINGIMGATTTQALIQAIETGNTAFLKKLPGIGNKTASQIILDLKGKLVIGEFKSNMEMENISLKDAYDALIALNFKSSDIDAVLKKLGQEKMTAQEYIKLALQQLGKRGMS